MSFRIEIIRNNHHQDFKIYNEIYRCWKESWQETIDNEFKNNAVLRANEFTQQDSIVAIFDGNKCFSLAFLRDVDTRKATFRDDEWLKQWTPTALNWLEEKGDVFTVCAYLTVDKEYRKSKFQKLSVSDLISYCTVSHATSEGKDNLLGMTRNSRGVNKNNYKFGAEPIEMGVINEKINELTDLVYFSRDRMLEAIGEYKNTELERIFSTSIKGPRLELVA